MNKKVKNFMCSPAEVGDYAVAFAINDLRHILPRGRFVFNLLKEVDFSGCNIRKNINRF